MSVIKGRAGGGAPDRRTLTHVTGQLPQKVSAEPSHEVCRSPGPLAHSGPSKVQSEWTDMARTGWPLLVTTSTVSMALDATS